MSRRSRHRGRYLPRSKRKKFRRGFYPTPQPAAVAPQQPTTGQRDESRAEVAVPTAKTPPPTPAAPPPPFSITAELRMIGIISGVILVIIIVLAFILP